MKLFRSFIAFGLILSILLLGTPTFAAGPGNANDFAPGRILVKFKTGAVEADKQDIQRRHGDDYESDISPLGIRVFKVAAGKENEKAAAYRGEPSVVFAEPDYIAKAIGTPNDPSFTNQWGLTKIQAPQAWDITTGSPSVKIAILDTGIDQNHEDLSAKIVANMNETTSGTADDLYGHGTHVAGIAAAITNNGIGVAGTGYNSSLMNVKVLDDTGSGYYSWIANGIIWAADNGANVINMSLGGNSGSSTLQSAVDYAWSKGVVVVAAAGNNRNTAPSYPAYYTNCIAVAATDQNDAKASWSTYGSWVDVAAPGVNIYSTLPNHSNQIGLNYGYLSGTSMATPFVSGLAALVWSTPYGTSNTAVRNRIQSTADAVAGTGTYWQYGRINAYKAVVPTTPTPPSLSVSVSAPGTTNVSSFTVQATVSNSGTTAATAATATITLPAGLTTADSLTRSLGDIAGGSSATASWSVASSADGTYSLSVTGSATNAPSASGAAVVTVNTAVPPPNQMHVQSITMALRQSYSSTRALATVTILDASGRPVSGATVSGQWSGATSGAQYGITNTSGQITFQSARLRRAPVGTTFTFTVTNAQRSGWTYNSAANVVTSASIVTTSALSPRADGLSPVRHESNEVRFVLR